MEKAIVNCKIKTFLTTGVISEKFENRQGTSIRNWEARFGLRTVPETSGKAMDMEPLGKIYIRTRGRYSRLDIRAIKEMRQRERIMPRKGNIWQRTAGLQGRM